MKRAKIILSVIALTAVVGGAFAFKATRFNGNPVWKVTNQITTVGGVYTSTDLFCTTANPTRFFVHGGEPVVLASTSTTSPISTVTLRNAANQTLTIAYKSCTQILTSTQLAD